jgi:predicted nucleotide-binding protein
VSNPGADHGGEKRSKISQSDIPNVSLEQAMKIAFALWENFAGKGAAPHNVAMALDLSPTSGGWRNLCGASIAYGLSEGGYNASAITLTELGRRLVAPTQEGDDEIARREAALKPRIPGEFFRRYDRAKFPRDDIAANVLSGMGIPKERAAQLVVLMKENGRYAGIIQETKTGPFVALDDGPTNFSAKHDFELDASPSEAKITATNMVASLPIPMLTAAENSRVFITHGKNAKIVEQIQKLVTLGGFTPIVSVQRETAAKPVPDKVMDDMRSCGAAVIHVGSEGILRNDDGEEFPQINPNVLIEIGAAMALYRGRFILVVEEGVKLPSNLQGLYESRYRGDSIELDAGMKVLEALRGLKAA